jgi:hypothetical protein
VKWMCHLMASLRPKNGHVIKDNGSRRWLISFFGDGHLTDHVTVNHYVTGLSNEMSNL